MAEKRMISKTIVDSDAFLDMPQTTQNLYFHLNVRADDEGFVDAPKKIMRSVGSNQNDIEILLAKPYIIMFESGVIVIKHWKLHNSMRKDRIKETLYIEEKSLLSEKENGAYTTCQPIVNQLTDNCPPSIVEVSIDKYSIDKSNKEGNKSPKRKRFSPDLSFILDVEIAMIFDKWCKGKSKKYKNQIQVEAGYNKLLKLSNGSSIAAIEIVNNSLASNWEGLFPLKDNQKIIPQVETTEEELNEIWKRNG